MDSNDAGFPGFYFRVSRPGRTLLGPGKLCLGLDGRYVWAYSEPVVPLPAFMVSERLGCDVNLPWRKSECRKMHAYVTYTLWEMTPDSSRS